MTNRRTDSYGGDPRSRARFAAEVVAVCRAEVGPDFPIVFRMSNWKDGDYHARLADNPDELAALLAPVTEAGVDMYHCSVRRHWEPVFEGSERGLAGWVRQLTGKPTMTVGSVGLDGDLWTAYTEGGQAEIMPMDRLLDQFDAGEFDMVAVGRALLGDPEWVEKIREGRYDELTTFHASMRDVLR